MTPEIWMFFFIASSGPASIGTSATCLALQASQPGALKLQASQRGAIQLQASQRGAIQLQASQRGATKVQV